MEKLEKGIRAGKGFRYGWVLGRCSKGKRVESVGWRYGGKHFVTEKGGPPKRHCGGGIRGVPIKCKITQGRRETNAVAGKAAQRRGNF